MNRTIATLIIGVVFLAMALVMVNQYATTPAEPPKHSSTPPQPQTAPETAQPLDGATVAESLPNTKPPKAPAKSNLALHAEQGSITSSLALPSTETPPYIPTGDPNTNPP